MQDIDYRCCFDSTPTPCLLLNTEFTIVAVTPAYAAATHRTDLLGMNMFVAFPNDPGSPHDGQSNLRSSLESVVQTLQPDTMAVQRYNIPITLEDGTAGFEERFWSCVNVPVCREPGKLLYLLHRAEDVTEFMQLQERAQSADHLRDQLRTSEMDLIGRASEVQARNKELQAAYTRLDQLDRLRTQFFANVSHELRTPISLILWPATQLLGRCQDEQERRDLQVICSNAQQLLRHVNALLDSSKTEAGQMTLHYARVDAAEVVRTAAHMFDPRAAEHRIHAAIEVPERLEMELDVEKLQGIVSNLLSNAFKYTPDAGRIRCSLRQEAGQGVLEVADSGMGIPEAQRERVFERFHQVDGSASRRRGGTGLGLSIVRDFATLHGGEVAARQAPEGGALFVVRLPLRAPEGTEVAATAAEAPAMADWMVAGFDPQRSKAAAVEAAMVEAAEGEMKRGLPKLLIVEDNPEVQWYLRQSLLESYQVECADNGRLGLEALRRFQPDACICDVMMPEMTGPEMLVEAKRDAAVADIPVLFLTAKSDDTLRLELLQAGAHDYLVKPFPIQELQARLRYAVSMRRTRLVLQAELDGSIKDLELLAQELALQKRKAQSLYTTAKEALAVRSDFLMVAAHELQTPVAGLQLQLERLRRRLTAVQGGDWAGQCDNIQRQSQRLGLLVSELLDASALEQGRVRLELADVELRAVAQDVCQNAPAIAAGADLPQVALVANAPVHGLWDRTRVEQILVNLLSNAIKYGEGKPVELRLTQDDDEAVLEIVDHGMGIAVQDQQRIFERFERGVSQRNISGWGVGLYIVRETAKMLGGSVAVRSELGQGSCFTVRLPCSGPEAGELTTQRHRQRHLAAHRGGVGSP